MTAAGPAAIITWAIAAAIMLCYGLVCAELSTRFPKSGGVFVFPSKALGKTEEQGRLWGWISTWGYINANIVAIAFAAIYVGTYLSVGFPIFGEITDSVSNRIYHSYSCSQQHEICSCR